MVEVKARAASLTGEEGKVARGKFVRCLCYKGRRTRHPGHIEELDMWIDDVNPVAQRFIEIASKERVAEAERQGMSKGVAKVLVRHAAEHNVALLGSADETENALTTYAGYEALYAMVEDLPNMAGHRDIVSFMKSHGVEIPGNPSPVTGR